MSEALPGWMARREAPPEVLRARLEGALSGPSGSDEAPVERLADAGAAALAEAAARSGRIREIAFALLDADALLTYACEAAVADEEREVEETLEAVLRRVIRVAP